MRLAKPRTGRSPRGRRGNRCGGPSPELSPLGTFDAPAANEPGETVRGRIFTYPRPVLARAAAEIAEIAWVDPTNPDRELAHLLRDEVFPALES